MALLHPHGWEGIIALLGIGPNWALLNLCFNKRLAQRYGPPARNPAGKFREGVEGTEGTPGQHLGGCLQRKPLRLQLLQSLAVQNVGIPNLQSVEVHHSILFLRSSGSGTKPESTQSTSFSKPWWLTT